MTLKRLATFVLALALIIPSAAAADDRTGVSDDKIRVGISTPISGPAALWSTAALGMNAWATHINEGGGIHGRKIELIIKDDGYNPERTVRNLQEMKDNVFVVMGLLGSAACEASKDFFPDNQIPLINAYGDIRIFADMPKEKHKWFFIAYPDYEDENEYLCSYGIESLGAKKIAHFYQNDDYGQKAEAGIKKAVAAAAGKAELIASVPYQVNERSMAPYAAQLKNSGADTLILTASPTHASLLIKAMAKQGYAPKVLTNFTVGDPIMYKIAGRNWEGTYVTAPGQMGMPGVDPAADRVAAILLEVDPRLKGREYLAIFGAVSMMHLAKGLELAGRDLTRQGLITAMEKIKDWKPEGMGAPVTYGPDRRQGVNAVRMSQARDGKIEPLTDFKVFAPRF